MTITKTVYIDSTDTERDDKNQIKVTVGHGLDNISRFCLKSFSIPNSFQNTSFPNNALHWVEFTRNTVGSVTTWSSKKYYIDLSGMDHTYSDNVTLINYINSRIALNDIRDFETGDASSSHSMTISMSYNEETYRVSVSVSNASVQTVFMPYAFNDDYTLWDQLGFENVTSYYNIQSILTHLQANFSSGDNYTGNTIEVAQNMNNSDSFKQKNMINGKVGTTAVNLTAQDVSRHENHIPKLFITSDRLAPDSYVMHDGHLIKTNIIDEVVNDVPKFSYLHKEINTPTWVQPSHKKVTEFDINILDHNKKVIPAEAMPHFQLALIFEIADEIEVSKELIEAYNTFGYRLAHPTN